MKHFLLKIIIGFAILYNLNLNAQTAGFNTTYAVLSINGGSNVYYDLQASTGNPDFQGANLGNFTASNSLLLKGAEHNVYKCGGCDLTSTRIYYRVYKTGTTPGSFLNLNIGYSSGFTNGCGGEDQQWSNTGYSTNILSGLSAGNYTFEVYSDASVTCIGGTVYAGNFGLNYKATFNYCGTLTGALTPGNYSIPGCFASVAAAASYLNTNGVTGSGTIQFDVAAGYTEIAPSTGILLNGNGTTGNLANGSATTPIVFKKNGVGANPKITAPLWLAGGNSDGIIKISGGDYITFDGFTIEENVGNTILGAANTMTEVGIGIFTGSVSNGAQHNTIKNCTILLNQNYPNSIGIFSSSSSAAAGTSLAATSTAGTNSFNTIESNSISNVAYGVLLITPPATATLMETGNLITGNTINFGNNTVSTATWSRFPTNVMAGVIYRNGTDVTMNNNTCISASLSYSQTTFGGILISSQQNPNSAVFSTIIDNNTITLVNNGSATTSGIDFGHGLSTSTHNANNNVISIECGSNSANSGIHQGIRSQYAEISGSLSGNTISISQSGVGPFSGAVIFINANSGKNNLTIQNNLLQSFNGHIKTSNIVYGISQNGFLSGNLLIGGSPSTSNTINIQRSTLSNAFAYGIYTVETTSTPISFNISYNNITFSNFSGSAHGMGIYDFEGNANTVKTINNNTISISGTHSGVSNGLFLSNGIFTVQNNIVNLNTGSISNAGIDFTINGIVNQALVENNSIAITSSSPDAIIRGIGTSVTAVVNGFTIRNNSINSISATATTGNPTLIGIRNNSGTNNIISGNTIKNFTTGVGTGNAFLAGIDLSGTSINPAVFANKIYNLESSFNGANSSVNGISMLEGATTYNIYNNFISDLKSPFASSIAAVNGINCFVANSTYKIYYNTIKLGTSTPLTGGTNFGVKGVVMFENTNSTKLDLRNNIININSSPSGLGYSSCVAIGSGTANVVPNGFQTTSNNNIYYVNSGSKNYLFAQGSSSAAIVNGFAVDGLIQNVANNVINDTNFNATCGYYKSFMGGTLDTATYTENNLVAGSSIATFIPAGNSFAENGAQVISSPSITVDFDGINRTPSNDIGALQFSGTSMSYTNPILVAAVTITITPTGQYPYLTPATLTVSTTNNAGTSPTFQWYVNGVLVPGATNTTFTSSSFEDYDVVTVQMTSNNNCVAVQTVTSNEILINVIYPFDTNVINTQCGITLNTINQYIYANNIPQAQAYRFRVTDLVTNQVYILEKALRVMQITQLPFYAFDRLYKIEVVTKVNGVWQHYGNPCEVRTPATTTSLVNCGGSVSAMNEAVYAINVPFATGYRFRITNTITLQVTILDNNLREFRFIQLPSPQFNTLYNVEVALRNTDGTYLPYGTICTVQSPPIPSSQLISSQCGASFNLSNISMYANEYIGATTYRFKIENSGLGYSYIFDKPIRTFILNQVPGLQQGQSYNVSVSLEVSGVFRAYGPVCQININGVARQLAKNNTFDVKGYPNPFSDVFKLHLTSSATDLISVKVYDVLGKMIDNSIINVDLIREFTIGNSYPSGVYNVIVTQGESSESFRMIKR
jgi:hypothetical protein